MKKIATSIIQAVIGKTFTTTFSAAALLLLTVQFSHAAPFEKTFNFKQPDGTQVELWGQGDEFHAVFEHNGYTVVFDPAMKTYYYAKLSADGKELMSTGLVVGRDDPSGATLQQHIRISMESAREKARARQREQDPDDERGKRWERLKNEMHARERLREDSGAQPAPPSSTTTGTKVGLTILIDFPSGGSGKPAVPCPVSKADVERLLNGNKLGADKFGNHGSVRDYFHDVSGGKLTYTNVVIGPITAPRDKSYYNNVSKYYATQALELMDDIVPLIKELPNYASQIKPQLDTLSHNGYYITAVNVFFAGATSGVWCHGLWPASYAHPGAYYNDNMKIGDHRLYFFQMTDLPAAPALDTFCHENGHMLCGFPDLYDYNRAETGVGGSGVGHWSLMCYGGTNGGKNPVQMDAYLKVAAGWATVTDLTTATTVTGTLTSAVGSARYNQFYRIKNPNNPSEYYLLENRQRAGWDQYLPGAGILIWHVNEKGDNRYPLSYANPPHSFGNELMLMQADGLWDIEKDSETYFYGDYYNYSFVGDPRDPWYKGNPAALYQNQFTDTSNVSAKWMNGTNSGINLNNFSANGASMTFTSTATVAPTRILGVVPASLAFGSVTVNQASPQTFTITNTGNSDLNVNSIGYSNAAFTGDWSTGKIVPGGSKTVPVTFKPTAATAYSGTITVNSDRTNTTAVNTVSVSGTGTAAITRIVSVSPASLAFGNMAVGQEKKDTFTIKNTGTGELNVLSIQYPSAVFTGDWPGGKIAPGGSKTVTVAFKPTAATAYSGTVTVNSDSTSVLGNTVSVNGTGMAYSLTISPTYMDASPAAGNFDVTVTANHAWSATSDQPWLTISNATGTGGIGSFKASYTAHTSVSMYRSATITVASTAASGGNTTRLISVWQYMNSISVTPTGNQNVGTASGSIPVTVKSNIPWTATSDATGWLTVSKSGGGAYGTTSAADDFTINYTANPTTSMRKGTVTVTGNASTRTITVTQAPVGTRVIRISSGSSLAFGTVVGRQTVTGYFDINNDGNSDLEVNSIEYPPYFVGDWSGGAIAAGKFKRVTVYFKPMAEQSYGGTITIKSNSTNGTGTDTLNASGTCVAPTLSVSLSGRRVPMSNGTYPVAVVSNIPWTASVDSPWLRITSGTSGSNNATIQCYVSTSRDGVPRTGRVTIQGTGLYSDMSATFTIAQGGMAKRYQRSVHETKVTAKTSALKEMKVKGAGAKIHYRVPVTKKYTILMAYTGNWKEPYANSGTGRMWAADKQKAIKFGGDDWLLKGLTAEEQAGFIGKKGQNIPEEGRYYNAADPDAPALSFTGLATMDYYWFSGSTGIVYGENFAPAPCANHPAAEQGEWEYGSGGGVPAGIYYPQLHLDEAPPPAHFHGTYTTRYNAKKSDALYGETADSLMDNEWIPKDNR